MLPLRETVKKKNTVNQEGSIIMSQRTKVTQEEKIVIAQDYLSGRISLADAARMAGVDRTAIRDWVGLYRQEGPLGFVRIEEKIRSYSPELKRQAVEAYLSGKGSLRSVCEEFKVRSKRQLQDWIKVYNSGKNFNKTSGGSRMKKSRNTTQEERIQIVKDCIESGYDYGEIAKKYDVGYQQVYTWVKKFTELGNAGLQDRRGQRKVHQEARTPEEEAQIKIAKLEHENYLLKMERDLLKKLEELERGDAFRK